MSLFKSREWWSVNLNEYDKYDSQCLITLTLDKDDHESILLGNHEGVLRLFSPSSDIVESVVLGYKPSHLMLEVQLTAPILQVNEGTLVSGSRDKFLAVLHPRLFSVYGIKKKENKENVGDQVVIELAYQHVLRHSSHSFLLGPFGGVRGRDFICIQSLDGLLSFYEQESFAFQLYLPNFILPHPFTYLWKTDSFLFLNGFFVFDCFTYEALASSGSSNEKKIVKTWEYNLGEEVIGITTLPKDGLVVVVLTERTFLALKETGKLAFMKRLEYKPVAYLSYLTEEDKRLMTVIATDGEFLHLYEDTSLKWSLKIDLIPVTVDRIFLQNLPGGLVLLSEDGYLQCVYIGTHPSVYLVPVLKQPEINVQKAEAELKELQQKISDNDIVDPVNVDLVTLDVRVDKNFKTEEGGLRRCNVTADVNVQSSVPEIQILFVVEPPLVAATPSWGTTNFCEKTLVDTYVYLGKRGFVSTLEVRVIVSYVTSEGVARCIQKTGVLPLGLVACECPAVKEAQHKLTICTNKAVVAMNQIFRDVSSEDASPNVIGLKYLNTEDVVTILAAKSSQRYRLQSDSLPVITLLLITLVERLKLHFRRESDFSLTFSASLPLGPYFDLLQNHHDQIGRKKSAEEKLSKQAQQYRTIQKKVLINLKDVTPKPSSNLHNILKETSNMVLTSLDELATLDDELSLSRSALGSACRLMVSLLELMSVSGNDLKALRIVFSPFAQDSECQGWLEVQEATASFLLRTILAKSTKDQHKPTDILLEPMNDTTKLVKHLSAVIDRVTKGTHLLERNEFESKKEPLPTIYCAQEWDDSFPDNIIPPSSQFINLKALNESEKSASNDKLEEVEKEERIEDVRENLTPLAVIEEEEKADTAKDPESHREPEGNVEMKESEAQSDDVDDDDDAIWDVKIEEMRI